MRHNFQSTYVELFADTSEDIFSLLDAFGYPKNLHPESEFGDYWFPKMADYEVSPIIDLSKPKGKQFVGVRIDYAKSSTNDYDWDR